MARSCNGVAFTQARGFSEEARCEALLGLSTRLAADGASAHCSGGMQSRYCHSYERKHCVQAWE